MATSLPPLSAPVTYVGDGNRRFPATVSAHLADDMMELYIPSLSQWVRARAEDIEETFIPTAWLEVQV